MKASITWLYAAVVFSFTIITGSTHSKAQEVTDTTTTTADVGKYEKLQSWAIENGARMHGVAIRNVTNAQGSSRIETAGVGIFASASLRAGHVFLTLPMSALFTASSSLSTSSSAPAVNLREVQDPILRLAVSILHEHQASRSISKSVHGKTKPPGKTDWAAFVESLPWSVESAPRVPWCCKIEDLTRIGNDEESSLGGQSRDGILNSLITASIERNTYVNAWYDAIYGEFDELERPTMALWNIAVAIVTRYVQAGAVASSRQRVPKSAL
jgi:hypothetical protein